MEQEAVMQREPVVLSLGTGRILLVYEGVMVAKALLVIALLPFPNEGWVRSANLAIWAIFVVDYFTRLGFD
jgi:hypothetical protein